MKKPEENKKMKGLLLAMFLVFVLISATVAGKYVQKENKLFRIIDSLNHETAEVSSLHDKYYNHLFMRNCLSPTVGPDFRT